MPFFDRITKGALVLSAAALAGLLIAGHPDMTTPLRVACIAAAAVGWLAAGGSRRWIDGAWVGAGILAPALLRVAAGREGPVLDVFWMAGLTASLLRTSRWSGWSLDPAFTLAAGAWALTVSLAWPVLAAREAAFDVRGLFDVGAVVSWSRWSAPHAIAWIAYIAWAQVLGLLWLDRLTADADRPRAAAHGLWIAATLASLVGLYQGLVDLSLLNTPYWTGLRRATGTLLDANAFGTCAALAGPAALLAFRSSRWPHAQRATIAIFAVNLAGLWVSGSRASLLCGVVATSGTAFALWRSADARSRRGLLLAGGAALAAAAIAAAASGAIGPARRLFERPEGASSYVDAVLNRPPYGPAALAIIRDYPLTGSGLGTYQQLAPDYWRRMHNEALNFDHAQNWWRHYAAELGLLGGALLFAWSALIAWRVLTTRARPGLAVEATTVRALLLGLGLASIIQIPTQPPALLLWFLLLLAWLPALVQTREIRIPRSAWIGAMLLAASYAAAHLLLARGSLAVAERARTFGREYVAGAYPEERSETGERFRWTDDDSRFVWPARSRWFILDLQARHPDTDKPVQVSIATPCGPLADHKFVTSRYFSLGVLVPEGTPAVDIRIRVSPTWRPSDHGVADSRPLGVTVAGDFVGEGDLAASTDAQVALPACPPGGL